MPKGEGYLMIDHRASPGVPEEIARSVGMDPALVKEGSMLEMTTMTCCHCKVAVQMNPMRLRARESCRKCGGKYICDFCYADTHRADYSHAPYEKRALDAMRAMQLLVECSPQPPALILPPTD